MKKSERAYQAALLILQDKPEFDESKLRSQLKESIPCSRTTAYKAVHEAKMSLGEREAAAPPRVHKIELLEAIKPSVTDITPETIEEIPEIPELEEIEKPEVPEGEPEFIRDMLQNLHELFLSSEGLLESYGVTKSEARGLGSQCYEVLKHRVGVENLRDFDIYLLIGSYLGVLGKIGVKVWRERRKTKKKEEKQKPKEPLEKS